MCKYLLNNGKICPLSKSLDRCSRHRQDKYKAHELDPVKANKMMDQLDKANIYSTVHCPCGTSFTRYNWSNHCSFPKHQAWAGMMDESDRDGGWSCKKVGSGM